MHHTFWFSLLVLFSPESVALSPSCMHAYMRYCMYCTSPYQCKAPTLQFSADSGSIFVTMTSCAAYCGFNHPNSTGSDSSCHLKGQTVYCTARLRYSCCGGLFHICQRPRRSPAKLAPRVSVSICWAALNKKAIVTLRPIGALSDSRGRSLAWMRPQATRSLIIVHAFNGPSAISGIARLAISDTMIS